MHAVLGYLTKIGLLFKLEIKLTYSPNSCESRLGWGQNQEHGVQSPPHGEAGTQEAGACLCLPGVPICRELELRMQLSLQLWHPHMDADITSS